MPLILSLALQLGRMLNQPNNRNRHHSGVEPITAVQYALVGVYVKLLNPPEQPRLLFTSLFCLFFCFVLLADFFNLVKIDNQYPNK